MTTADEDARRLEEWSRAVDDAGERIGDRLPCTPLREGMGIGSEVGSAPLLKLENHQPTGSFKVRGAFSKLLALGQAAGAEGVVAASTGNHGAAVAFAARQLNVPATVVVPEPTPAGRVQAIESFGARALRFGEECGEAEAHARTLSAQGNGVFLSPYNDLEVMAGQGTMGRELMEQAPQLDAVYVAAGGGGLIGGVAAAIKSRRPGCAVIGVSPAASRPLHAAVEAGRIVDVPHEPTLSLATAGALEADTVTLAPAIQLVDRWLVQSEESIGEAMRMLFRLERLMVEGAAGLALAGWLAERGSGRAPARSAVVICGGNLDQADLMAVHGGRE